MAKKLHGVKTKAVQMDCLHLSDGGKSVGYYRCLLRLIEKYPNEKLIVTSSENEETEALKHLLANKDIAKIMECFASRKVRS